MAGTSVAPEEPQDERIDAELREDIGFLISICRSIAMRHVKTALGPLNLRARSYSLLALAATNTGCTQREAATALYLEPSQVVPLVDELVGLGLVERRPHPTDRRVRVLTATAAGRETYANAESRVATAMDEVLSDLDTHERGELRAFLLTVIARHESNR